MWLGRPSISRVHPAAQHLLKRFELYLALGATVFVGVVYWMFVIETDTGITVAVTVIGMGLIQGAIQWADRERSARLRRLQIHEIREMLRDQILNQLSAVKLWTSEPPDPASAEVLFEELNESVDSIARLIDQLSERQLDTWKLTYANAADHIAMSDAPLDAMPTRAEAIPGAPVRPSSRPAASAPTVDALPAAPPEAPAPAAVGTMIVRAEAPAPAPTDPTVAVWH